MYTPGQQSPVGRLLVLIGVISLIAISALAMLGLLGYRFGPGLFAVALLLALLPVPIVVLSLLWLDRYEPEPWYYLVIAFGFGAFVATLAALILNTSLDLVIGAVTGQQENTVTAVFVAPPVEESGKALPLLLLFFFRRKEIDGIVDGIVYAGISAAGFAFTENILYYGQGYQAAEDMQANSGVVAVIFTFVLRALLSPFAHPLFTAMTGIGVGLAVRTSNWGLRILYIGGGLLLAMILHGTWNGIASIGPKGLLIGYPLLMVPIFFTVVGLAIWVRSREGRMIGQVLPTYVQTGWISPPEVAALSSLGGRRASLRWAAQLGGQDGKRAMREFQFVATKLALLRSRLQQGTADSSFSSDESSLLARLRAQREPFLRLGPYGAAPPPSWLPGYRQAGPMPVPGPGGPYGAPQPYPGPIPYASPQPYPPQPYPTQPYPPQPGAAPGGYQPPR
jgi:RsiW-degrading membrane proteinase PrsW (M82 family)